MIITNSLLDKWGDYQKELHGKAMENLKADGYRIRDMLSLCQEMLGEKVDVGIIGWDADMYVLTNQRKM